MASKKSFKFWFWTTYIAAAGWTILYTYFGHFLITDNRLPILCHFDSRKFFYHGGRWTVLYIDFGHHSSLMADGQSFTLWFCIDFVTDDGWVLSYIESLDTFHHWWCMGNLSRHWLWTLFIIDFRCAFFIDLQYCTLFITDGGYAIFEFYFGHVFITKGGWVML